MLSIKQLKNNKATGPDRIPNEFIKNAPTKISNIILQFFNLNIEKGLVALSWCLDFISPIHKEGPLKNPDNYRGLIIMNTLLKLFCSILNRRLINFWEDNNILNKEQIGFCKNARTSDQIFTLKTLVNKYVTEKRAKSCTHVSSISKKHLIQSGMKACSESSKIMVLMEIFSK